LLAQVRYISKNNTNTFLLMTDIYVNGRRCMLAIGRCLTSSK